MNRHRVLILALVLTGACAPRVRTTMIGEPRPTDTGSREIMVYSARVPDCSFDEIALISAGMGEFPKPGTGMDDLLEAMKDRARELGGHALVGLAERPRTKVEGPSLTATVVRFRENDCESR